MENRKAPKIVIIGGGHAGVEAAAAAVMAGAEATLITPDPSKIALMSCNPSIGGIAKGTLVRELDGLGGVSPLSADRTAIQFRMLNMKKGPAVWGPRVQTDVKQYCMEQRKRLEELQVKIVKGMVERLHGPSERIEAVVLQDGRKITGDGFILAAGTFLGGMLHRGTLSWPGGRRGDVSSQGLDTDLRERMFHVKRFKTGTSPRILRSSINTEVLEEQTTTDMDFSFSRDFGGRIRSIEKCWVTRTNGKTEEIVRNNLRSSPLYAGRISGRGPRYCPSFEDKVVKFPDRTGHPIHVEPMGTKSRIMYLNGLSTSLPEGIQEEIVRSLDGFEKAVIAAYGYSVEYTCLEKGEFSGTLRIKGSENLYAAGQVLGTSGYEEAAAAGFLAGANAAARLMDREETVPDRMESYLGVMVDDLVHKGAEEPYRLFSSRSENRLHLRQDNAQERVLKLGEKLGTLGESRLEEHKRDKGRKSEILNTMRRTRLNGQTIEELCRRPEFTVKDAAESLHTKSEEMALLRTLINDLKYSGYVKRAERKNRARARYRSKELKLMGDYGEVDSLSIEAAQALNGKRPETLGEAEKLPGVREADVEALILHLMKRDVSRGTS